MTNKSPDEIVLPKKEPILRVVPMPPDVNRYGDIFGGWIMAQVDIAGGMAAMRRARGRVVTVSVDAFNFKEPVLVGDLLSFYADIINVGRTSIKVEVTVFAERNPEQPVLVKVTYAVLTFVAINQQGGKREVPPAEQ